MKSNSFQNRLHEWYLAEGRSLPWRAECTGAKKIPDPYRVWLSEIMLQQTTVQAVIPYFTRFLTRWPQLTDLAKADAEDVLNEWAGLGYYSRARNLIKCARLINAEFGGVWPQTSAELRKLPGIGPYTADAIAAIAFEHRVVPLDGNIERVAARFFGIRMPLPAAKPELKNKSQEFLDPDYPPSYTAQALMDIGARICTPRAPKCPLCPLSQDCFAQKHGEQNQLPVKPARPRKKVQWGYLYWIENPSGTHVLIERRPESGILAGMQGFPTSTWFDTKDRHGSSDHIAPADLAPVKAAEADPDTRFAIKHVFTHIELILTVINLRYNGECKDLGNLKWARKTELQNMSWPSLFRKVINMKII